MSKIILHPVASVNSRKHYNDTIEKPVPISRIGKFVSKDDLHELEKLYPNGKLHIWGVLPGTSDYNIKKWERINIGDICLFSGGGKYFSSGTVKYKIHNCRYFHLFVS